MKRKILYGLVILLVAIQFIRPAKNQSGVVSSNDISKAYTVPADIDLILKKACNDCHSNNTVYPWYSNIQPVAWWLQDHVNDGKKHLNLSEFLTYPAKRQYKKLDEVIETVKEGEMPLNSYTWIHKEAILTDTEKLALSNWANGIMKQLEASNPGVSVKEERREGEHD